MSAKIIPLTQELKKYGLNPKEWNPIPQEHKKGKVLFFNKRQKDYYFEGQVSKDQITELELKVS